MISPDATHSILSPALKKPLESVFHMTSLIFGGQWSVTQVVGLREPSFGGHAKAKSGMPASLARKSLLFMSRYSPRGPSIQRQLAQRVGRNETATPLAGNSCLADFDIRAVRAGALPRLRRVARTSRPSARLRVGHILTRRRVAVVVLLASSARRLRRAILASFVRASLHHDLLSRKCELLQRHQPT